MWFYKLFNIKRYCSPNKLKLIITIKKNNKVLYKNCVSNYTFISLNWLHNIFYKNEIKIRYYHIADYLIFLILTIEFYLVNKTIYSLCNNRYIFTLAILAKNKTLFFSFFFSSRIIPSYLYPCHQKELLLFLIYFYFSKLYQFYYYIIKKVLHSCVSWKLLWLNFQLRL